MRRLFLFILLLSFFGGNSFATNRALLIGIGKYRSDTGWKSIHGDADIELLKPKLEKYGFVVNTLINEEATKEAIQGALIRLKEECQLGDKIYFHFSGHGQPITDGNGDETNELDEAMIPYDAGKYYIEGKYEGEKHLIDDEYNQVLAEIKRKIGKSGEFFMAVDACHSRGMERGGDSEDIEDMDILNSARGTDDEFIFEGQIPNSLIDKPLPQSLNMGAKLIVVSACKEDERNYEYKTASGKMYGSLSYCISELLKVNVDFNKWVEYFQDEQYRKQKIFQLSQHPSIVIYD